MAGVIFPVFLKNGGDDDYSPPAISKLL